MQRLITLIILGTAAGISMVFLLVALQFYHAKNETIQDLAVSEFTVQVPTLRVQEIQDIAKHIRNSPNLPEIPEGGVPELLPPEEEETPSPVPRSPRRFDMGI